MIEVSIVLYNTDNIQLTNLLYILNSSSLINNIFLIDNSPNESSIDYSIISSKVTYIYTNKNIGYGAGHNIGIKKAISLNSDYHIVINPDIIFDAADIAKLLNYMEANKEIGLVMPKIIYPNGEIQTLCKLIATPLDLFIRRFIPIKKWNDIRNNKYELHFTGYNKIMHVPSLSGCFMFFRINVIERIGGFDERFFMYCEDFDLCRRIGQISKTVFYPEISVIHNYEKGSYKNSKLLIYHIQSAFKYFNKWGWFFDMERKRINRETLNALGYKNKKISNN